MPNELCEACGVRPAEFVITSYVGNHQHGEKWVCGICARDAERFICGNYAISLVDLLESQLTKLRASEKENRTKVCPTCGNTIDETRQTGMVGCSMCYVVLREEIEPLIVELHGYMPGSGRPL